MYPSHAQPGLHAVTFALSGVCLLQFALLFAAIRWSARLRRQLREQETRRKSLSATYGRITEQWIPLSQAYPYDSHNFRFLGSPIDGVQFEDDRIVLVEFKTNGSRLSERQKQIKQMVEEGRVEWQEFHFTE